MGMIDTLRAWFAPKKRASDANFAATFGSGAGGGFAGGGVSRLTASLATWSGAVNLDLDGSLVILRARGRQLAQNNEHGRRFLSLVATNVIGRTGPKLQVRALFDRPDKSGRPVLDKAANDAVEAHWARWSDHCDVGGRLTLPQMMRVAIKAVARDGESLLRIVRDAALPCGIGLQLLEADRLDESINVIVTDRGTTIRQGVEINRYGRPVAYWIKTAHPGERYGASAYDVERVDARDVLHLYLPERAEQLRGYTWFHAVLLRQHQLHGFNDAAVLAARIGASKIAALERSEDAPDSTAQMADAQSGGAMQMNVEAGELFELPPGYKLNSWNPEYPHANFESFVKAALRGVATGLDVATHNLTGDMTDVNYSSARIAELAEREMWIVLQDWWVAAMVQPIYRQWAASAFLRGDVTFPSGSVLPAEKLNKFIDASRFQGRRWGWVDPVKEVKAFSEGLAARVTSRTRICAEQGDDFDDILDELAAEEDALAKAFAAPEPGAA
jgi:lambda family phage portal protein